MGWLRKLIDKLKVKKAIPIPVPVERLYMHVDGYLWDLVDRIKDATQNERGS